MLTKDEIIHSIGQHISSPKAEKQEPQQGEDEEIDVEMVDESDSFIAYENLKDLSDIRHESPILEEKVTDVTHEKLHNLENLDEDWSDSDADDIESDEDDCLKHSGIYATQEIVRMQLNNLKKLLAQYKCELSYLEHKYKQLDVKYQLPAMDNDRKIENTDNNELNDYEKLQLKTWQNYNRNHELNLRIKLEDKEKQLIVERYKSEKRNQDEYENEDYLPNRPNNLSKESNNTRTCCFADDSIKCCNQPLEFSKYCLKHILKDNTQTLFRPCGIVQNGSVCLEPIYDYGCNYQCTIHVRESKLSLEDKKINITNDYTECMNDMYVYMK